MTKARTTTVAAAYPLVMAAILAAATAQFSPGPAPEMPMGPGSPGPFPGNGAPSPGGVDCFTYLINLSDCLTFVEGGSNLTKPDPGCCPELDNLVNTQPVCLCELLGNPGQVGITVDTKKALQLPAACNVTTPPVSLCAAIGVPVGALTPTEAPSPSPGAEGSAGGVPPSGGAPNLGPKRNLVIGLGAALLFTFFF